MTVITMSRKEIDRMSVLRDLADGRIKIADASTLMGLGRRQVFRLLEPTGIARSLARKRVTVIDYPDGRLAIRYNGVDLPYRTFDKRPQVNQAAIIENKRLGPILAYIAEKQKELDMSRSAKAPRRRGQKNHMFKVG